MNKKFNILIAIIAAGVLSIVSNAQDVTGVIVASSVNVVKGAPYSADSISETVRTLADGNRITNSFKRKIYRDSEGRTRTEDLPPTGISARYLSLRETITITDPVAGFSYYLNPVAKTVRRLPITTKSAITVVQGTSSETGFTIADSSQKVETIDGLSCTLNSFKSTIAAGAIGNEREIVSTSEICFSNDLKAVIFSKRNDPQSGDSTYKLTNIIRAEPDKELFTVPADYKLLNDPSPVNVTVKNNP